MITDNGNRPYPLDAFYIVPGDAANETVCNTQAPAGLVGMEFLADMAAAAQGLFDVQLPSAQRSPTSLAVAIVAESGERMTGVHRLVARPLYEFDAERIAQYEAKLKIYNAAYSTWGAVEAGLRRAVIRATQNDESTEELQAKLTAWQADRPIKPRARRIVRQNMSERALMEVIQGDGEAIGIISDELDHLVRGGLFDKLGLSNKLWDGPPMLTYDRGNGVSIVARNPRVTIAFKAHPEVLKEQLNRRGGVMRGSGHWARYLIGNPPSTQGMRFTSGLEQVWLQLPKFHDRMRELLEEYGRRVDDGRVEREVLTFSADAKRRWTAFSNQIETSLQPLGFMNNVKDCASKAMELMGRVAALLHVFSGQEGEMSSETLERASFIIEWHVYEFKCLFAPDHAVQQEQVDAQTLSRYLYNRYWCNRMAVVAKNEVLRNGPLRPSKRFEEALGLLVMWNQVFVEVGPKRQLFIRFNQHAFAGMASVA